MFTKDTGAFVYIFFMSINTILFNIRIFYEGTKFYIIVISWLRLISLVSLNIYFANIRCNK